jgi:hypothetical protein
MERYCVAGRLHWAKFERAIVGLVAASAAFHGGLRPSVRPPRSSPHPPRPRSPSITRGRKETLGRLGNTPAIVQSPPPDAARASAHARTYTHTIVQPPPTLRPASPCLYAPHHRYPCRREADKDGTGVLCRGNLPLSLVAWTRAYLSHRRQWAVRDSSRRWT